MSFIDTNSTIAENVTFLMYTYSTTYYDYLGSLHVIMKKIEYYDINNESTNDICTATTL